MTGCKPLLQIFQATKTSTLPSRGSAQAAGLDLSADIPNEVTGLRKKRLLPGQRAAIDTGIKVAIPEGYYGRVAPRSGLAFKHGIDVLAGVIDSDYRGELKVILLNTGDEDVVIEHGERIAQLIIEKIAIPDIIVVGNEDDLSLTGRGENGFGSTGK